MAKPYDQEWAVVESSPAYQNADPRDKADLARYFARKRVKQQGGDTKAFLERALPAVEGAKKPGVKNALKSMAGAAAEGFKSSSAGMVYHGQLPEEQPGIIDSWKNVLTGGNSLNPFSDGAGEGYAGLAGTVAPDVAVGGLAGSAAKAALTKAGVKALPAAVAASVGTGAAVPAGAVKYAGGTNDQALTAGVAGAAGGLLPFARGAAGRVPAGKWNPNIGGGPKAPPPPPGGQQQQAPPPPPPGGGGQQQPPPGAGQAPPGGWRTQPPPGGGSTGTKPPPPPPGGGQTKPPPGAGPQKPPRPKGQGWKYDANSNTWQRPSDWQQKPPPGAGPKQQTPPPGGGPRAGTRQEYEEWKTNTNKKTQGQREQWAREDAEQARQQEQQRGPQQPPPPDDSGTWEWNPRRGEYRRNREYRDKVRQERREYWDNWKEDYDRTTGQRPGGQPPPPGGGPKAGPQQEPAGPYTQRVPFDEEATNVHKRYVDDVQSAKDYITQAQRELDIAKQMRDAAEPGSKKWKILDQQVKARETDVANAPRRVKQKQDAADDFVKKWDQWNQGGKRGGRPGFIKWDKIVDAAAKGAFKVAGLGAEGVRRTWKAGGAGATLAAKGANALTPEVIPNKVERNALIPLGQAAHQWSEDLGINDVTRAFGKKVDEAMVTPLKPEQAAKYVGEAAAGPVTEGVNALRRSMVSGYGVPDEVHQRFIRVSPAKARETFRPTHDLFNEMAQKPTGEQFDIHYQATEPTYTGPLSPEAQRIQEDNLRISEEMLRAGVITQKEFDRWAKHYLPREYARHETDDPKAYHRGKRNRAKIDVPAGRGTTERMSENEMLAQNASGARWETLGPPDAQGNVVAWRDWTPEERASWGEHRNLGRAGAKKIAQGEANLAAADFLAWVARRPEYARRADQVLPGLVEGQHPETITDPDGTVWKMMPNTAAGPGVGRVRKYGNLAGMYVKKDIHDYIYDQMELETLIPTMEKISLNPLWKKAMTIGNLPGYFINNIGHNIPMLLTNGGAISDLPGAFLAIAEGNDQVANNLLKQGYIRNDGMRREMAANLAKALRNRYSEDVPPGPFSFTRAMMETADTYKQAEGALFDLAQTTDDAFRVALVKRLMADGVPYEEAAARMNRVFYNPQNVTAPLPRIISAMPMGAPFAKVNWYLTDAITQTAVNNPVRSMEMVGLYKLMPYLLGAAVGLTIEEVDRQRKALPHYMQGTGNALPLGKQGGATEQDHWLGTMAFNPGQNWMENPNVAVPGMPRGLNSAGPWKVAYDLFMSNYDPSVGKEITERDSQGNIIGRSLLQNTPLEDSGVDLSEGAMDYASRNLMPGSIDKGRRFIDTQVLGHTTNRGDVVEPVVGAERLAGLQVQPVDPEHSATMAGVMGKVDAGKYKAHASKLMRLAAKIEKTDPERAEQYRAEALEYWQRAKQAGKAGTERAQELRPKNNLIPTP